MADSNATAPEEVSTKAIQHVRQVLTKKDEHIRLLQSNKFYIYDDYWMKTQKGPPNLQRSADAVFDGNDIVYLRQARSDP